MSEPALYKNLKYDGAAFEPVVAWRFSAVLRWAAGKYARLAKLTAERRVTNQDGGRSRREETRRLHQARRRVPPHWKHCRRDLPPAATTSSS